jgi:hypothetical protein
VQSSLFAQDDSQTVASTATESTLLTTGLGSATLPEDYLVAGRSIRIKASGHLSAVSSADIRWRVRIGGLSGTIVGDTGDVDIGTAPNQLGWTLECTVTCRSTGMSGTAFGQGHVVTGVDGASPKWVFMTNTAAASGINTASGQAVVVSADWTTGSASNTITCTNLVIEQLY